MGRQVEVEIESLAFRGHGVARVGGKVVFVPFSVTGDKAWIEITEEKKDHSRGEVVRLVQPSPWRAEPACPHFGRCGGCQWQHIDPSAHGGFKAQILQGLLSRIGGLRETLGIHVIPSLSPYGYRVRVQLKVGQGRIGYFEERSHRIVDVHRCPVAHPLINEILSRLREGLPLFSRFQEIEINVSPEEGSGVLLLRAPGLRRQAEASLQAFLRSQSVVKGMAVATRANRTVMGDTDLHFTLSWRRETGLKRLRFQASPASFFQIHPEQNRHLVETVLEYAGVNPNDRVLDLYAGIGNLTLPLALEAGETYGVEENREAVRDARVNLEGNGIERCEFVGGRVEDVLKRWRWGDPQLITVDPPRTGCRHIVGQLVDRRPRGIVYVSCSPDRFARDLRSFDQRGYHLEKLTLIDMFPQTYHMECVGFLRPPC